MLMSIRAAVAMCTVSALVALEQPAAGQPSSLPLDQAIAVGQVVSVQTTDGRTIEGTVSAVSATALDLNLDSRTADHLPIERIRQVDLKYHDPTHHATKKGFLIGLAAGAAVGTVVAARSCGPRPVHNPSTGPFAGLDFDLSFCNAAGFTIFAGLFGGIGGGAGAIIGRTVAEDLNARRTIWKAVPPSLDRRSS